MRIIDYLCIHKFKNINYVMNEDNIAIRLKGFMDSIEMTSSQFADQCGIARPTLSQLLTGRNKKISDVLVGQIHKAFPRLSVVWLLFGEGEMLTPLPSEAEPEPELSPLFSDTEKFVDDESEMNNYSNLSALNEGKKVASIRMNKEIETDKKTKELESEIEKMRRNPRRVTHITIYYDDSTFETFYPGEAGRQ